MNDITPLIASLARAERQQQLDDAFESAENIAEMMEIFTQIEAFASRIHEQSDDARYGLLLHLSKYPLSIIPNLLRIPLQKPELVYCFGKAALSVIIHTITCFGSLPPNTPILDNDARIRAHGSTLYFACVDYILGSACLGLGRYYESLGFLERADTKLRDLVKNNDGCDRNCVWNLLAATHHKLYILRVAMGKQDEAILHVGKALRYRELMLNSTDCIELGNACFEAYAAYVAVKDLDRAIPLCLRTLDIYARHQGQFSREVMVLRVDLGVLYYVREEDEKADQQHDIWRAVLVSSSSDNLNADIKMADMLIHWGMCKDAFGVMRRVTARADVGRGGRVTSLVKMASACCTLGRFDDAKKYLGEAKGLEENDIDPIFFGNVFVNMSILYEKMQDFDSAVFLLKRVLDMAEYYQRALPEGSEKLSHQNLFAVSSGRLYSLTGRLFSFFSLSGWAAEDILQYMINMTKKLEEIFGMEHIEVGYGYSRLGIVLMKSGNACQAVTLFQKAMSLMEVSLGPHHMDTLRTSHTLYEIYVKQRRFNEAMGVKEKVTEGSKGLGPSENAYVEKLLDY